MIDYYTLGKVMNTTRGTSKKTGEELTKAYMETMKNVTRAAIFAQLYRKPELTATEISKLLGEDVDVVYYHMKLLRKMGLVTEPRVEVRGNYIEKYYSLTAEAKQSILGEERRALESKVLDTMDPEEFRQVLMTAFALVQSLTAGAINQIKQVDREVIAELKEKRSVSIQIVGCTEDRYFELLDDLKEIARVRESASQRELGYMIVFWALPQLDAG